ncbi:MAG: acyl-CoA thioesterase [Gammaproteobacteria bacterium]|jgi:acyl-CoA thioesterase YciA|nr:acyl-CoA thioesterase [Gammaproteobacteria bacterium]
MMQDQLPAGLIPTLRIPAMPKDVNNGGSIFGGWVMSYVDIAGSIPAELRAMGRIVTRAVQAFEFKKPVYVGDLVSFYAHVIKEGRTSVTVQVDVYAQRIKQGIVETVLVTDAILIYVAIDEKGHPRPLPPL